MLLECKMYSIRDQKGSYAGVEISYIITLIQDRAHTLSSCFRLLSLRPHWLASTRGCHTPLICDCQSFRAFLAYPCPRDVHATHWPALTTSHPRPGFDYCRLLITHIISNKLALRGIVTHYLLSRVMISYDRPRSQQSPPFLTKSLMPRVNHKNSWQIRCYY